MDPRRLTLVTVIVAILVLVGVVVVPRLTSKGTPAAAPSGSSATGLSYDNQPAIGETGAPVKIALFEDFLCPHCAEFSDQVWPQVKRAYIDTGKARAWFFYFPVIDQVQSRVIGGLGQCVYFQSEDAFWNLEPILMRSQQQLFDTSKAIDIAAQYAPGLDRQQLQQCVDNGKGAQAVDRDAAMAHSLGLQGTPTVLVNGQAVPDASWASVKKAIDAALAGSSASGS